MSSHFQNLRVRDIRRETPDCVSVVLEVPENHAAEFAFRAGQNLTLKKDFGKETIRRSYSICSSPSEGELRVAIKTIPGGRFSTFANEQLRVGDFLEVLAPSGNFFTPLDPRHHNQYVALAAGSGITPIYALLKATLETEPFSRFSLFYGNRRHQDVIFREGLLDLKNRYPDRLNLQFIFSREQTDAPFNSGRIDEEKCREIFSRLVPLSVVSEIFLCGPAAMTDQVTKTLTNLGFPTRHLHRELFLVPDSLPLSPPKPGSPEETPGPEIVLRILLDGVLHSFLIPQGVPSLLEAALQQGLDLPFSCRGGVCATCKAKLLEGEVEMARNYALEKEELDKHFILSCQARPLSARISLDFDAK